MSAARVLLVLLSLPFGGCVIVGQHFSNPGVDGPLPLQLEACEVTADYLGVGFGWSWRHERGTTRVYTTAGIKDVRQCATVDADYRDISPGAQLLVIREFDRRDP